jgi:hypothetical protein
MYITCHIYRRSRRLFWGQERCRVAVTFISVQNARCSAGRLLWVDSDREGVHYMGPRHVLASTSTGF